MKLEVIPPNETIDACLPQLTAQSAAWHDLSLQLGVVCLVIGFAIGMTTMYIRLRYGCEW